MNIADLTARRQLEALESRLANGWAAIDEAARHHDKRREDRFFQAWLGLLREYETLYDRAIAREASL